MAPPAAAIAGLRLRTEAHGLPVVVIAATFAASRAAAYAAGVRFDSSSIGLYLQFVDPDLLANRLAESLFYLHSQPPLFNLYLGILLKAFPADYAAVAQAAYLVLGIVGAVALYALLLHLGCGRWIGTAVAVLMTVAPATILYENWLFYEYAVAVLLVLSALALARFADGRSAWFAFLFFLLVAAVIWTRSAFQIPWMLLALGLVLAALRDRRRVILRASLVPLLLVVALYAKNWALFGVESTSSWFGMNMARTVFNSVSPAERAERVARGDLSRVSLEKPFSQLDRYRGLVPLSRPTGIPVLDEERLPGETPNLNNKSYVRISDRYLGDSLHLIRDEPSAYARSIAYSIKLTFQPSTDYGFVATNRAKIGSYAELFDRAVYVQTPFAARVGLAILAAYGVAVLYGLWLLRLWIRQSRRGERRLVTLLYAWWTVVYTLLVLTFTSGTENQRIRFVTDPLVAVLVACAVGEAWPALRNRVARRRQGSAGLAG